LGAVAEVDLPNRTGEFKEQFPDVKIYQGMAPSCGAGEGNNLDSVERGPRPSTSCDDGDDPMEGQECVL